VGYKKPLFIFLIAFLTLLIIGCEEESSISCIEWTPDGKNVVFAFDEKIYLYEVGSKEFARPLITKGLVEDRFCVSRDGRYIYFSGNLKGSFDIWQLEIESRKLSRLTEAPEKEFSPVISPDGRNLFYIEYKGASADLWRLDLPTKKRTRLTRNPDVEMFPAVSPDGTLLAYASVKPTGEKSLNVIDPDTKKITPLIGDFDSILSIRFSPDGKYIGFVADGKVHSILLSYRELSGKDYLKRLAGLKKAYKVLAGAVDFDWDDDSDAALYSDASGDIFTKKLGGARGRRFLASAGREDLPRCSPDGKYIALATGVKSEGKKPVSPALLVISRDGKRYYWGFGKLRTIMSWCKEEGRFSDALWAAGLLEKETSSAKELQELYGQKAAILMRLGEYSEAAEIYRKHFQEEPLKLVEVYLYYTGDFEKAREILSSAEGENGELGKLAEQALPLDDAQLKLYCEAQRKLRDSRFKRAVKARENFIHSFPGTEAAEAFSFEIGEILFAHMNQPARALETYRRSLREYPDSAFAVDAHATLAAIYKSQRRWPRALEEIEDLLKICRDNTRCAQFVLEGTRILLFNLKDKERARNFARQLVKFKPPQGACEVLVEDVTLFDKSGDYDIANDILKLLIAEYEVDVRDLPGLIRSLDFLSEDEFVSARFDKIPAWFLRRVDILIEAMPEAPERDDLRALKIFFLQKNSADLIKAWEKTEYLTQDMDEELYQNIRSGVFYSIANMAQNEKDVLRALRYYSKLALSTGPRELYRTYEDCILRLEEAKGGRRKELESVFLGFLNAERDRRVAFWGDVSKFYAIASEAGGMPSGEIDEERLNRARIQKTNAFYRRVLSEKLAPPILDNARYRLISALRDEDWYLYADTRSDSPGIINPRTVEEYVGFLHLYPASELYGRAFDELMAALEGAGNYWLALNVIKDLRSSLEQASGKNSEAAANIPLLLLSSGKIFSDKLLMKGRGSDAFEEIVRKYPQSPQWPEAAKCLALYYDGASEYAGAIRVLTELIEKRPDFEWVVRGDAALALARAFEKNQDWENAEKNYVTFLTDYGDHPDAESGALLLEIFERLSEKAIKEIYTGNRDAIISIMPEMNISEKEKLLNIIPALRDEAHVR